MTQGHEVSGRWWRDGCWKALGKKLPGALAELLDPLRQVLVKLEALIAARTVLIEAQAGAARQRPKGLGALTERVIKVMEKSKSNLSASRKKIAVRSPES